MNDSLPRAVAALVTPFDRSGALDLEAHRVNVETLASHGLDGLLIGGSTGEGPYLEPGERRTLTRAAREVVGSNYRLLVGTSAETVRTVRSQIEEAADGGADAVLVVTPTTMARGDTAAVLRFYVAAARHSPVPLLLYSVPRYTAYELPELAVERLWAVPGIIGMKDSGGDVRRIARMIAKAPDDFALYNGASAVLGQTVWSGAWGGITASANYAPALMREVATRPTIEAQRRLAALAATVETHGVPGVKAAAVSAGLRPGMPRAPLAHLPADARRRLAAAADHVT